MHQSMCVDLELGLERIPMDETQRDKDHVLDAPPSHRSNSPCLLRWKTLGSLDPLKSNMD